MIKADDFADFYRNPTGPRALLRCRKLARRAGIDIDDPEAALEDLPADLACIAAQRSCSGAEGDTDWLWRLVVFVAKERVERKSGECITPGTFERLAEGLEREFLNTCTALLRHQAILRVLEQPPNREIVQDLVAEVGLLLGSRGQAFGRNVLPSCWKFAARARELADLRLALLAWSLDTQEAAYCVDGRPNAYRNWLRDARSSVEARPGRRHQEASGATDH